ncbi:lytic transglycosylase domain-containing protein [Sphingobium phenoxybenzoativorans]|jgi:hypothetical protein|uniref:Lytic transglycosylase domain-containing protein n=1 Tax=Sphingobium phenoxybenzoativorans TaxID=1592790 RepID=A0A975KA42_9SPHN|nr:MULTISPECIES: lytic transglycosylase domain-containing protein [Sphingobium]QUT07611.1 lytic transglycosylase domain-containing protein [Sphingobium phenoxybenzoativorans]
MPNPNWISISRSRIVNMILPMCAGIALLAAIPGQARAEGEGETRIAHCIRQAAGDKPWLEKTLWGLRDQEGGWIGAEVRNTNGSHDLGPLQINSWWVPKLAGLIERPEWQVRHWLRFDPCFNADAARWIFLAALHSTGDFWEAVGVYHSPTAWRQRRYAQSVARHMQRRFGRDLFAARTQAEPTATPVAAEASATGGQTATPAVRTLGFGVVRRPPS